jgi:PKD domain
MIRARRLRAALVSVVVLCSLVLVASAGAAAWQGPAPISTPAVNAGDRPLIALGSSGDAAAGWWDETNARAVIARKRAGGAWSSPMGLGASGTPLFVYTGVDASGNVTAAFNTGAIASVATWAASASAPTVQPPLVLPGVGSNTFTADDLAVNAAGDAVLVGESGTDLITAYRHGFAGAWELQRWTANAATARVAINPLGMAVVVYRDNANLLWGSTRTATVDWALAEQLSAKTLTNIVPTVGIDGAGNYLTAFTYDNGTATVVRSVLRSPGAGAQESGDLSSTTAMIVADQPEIAVNAAGAALLAWKQTGAALADSSVQARYGTTGAGWGAIEPVNDAGADTPFTAIGADGRAAVAWERATLTGNTGQTRIRAPGAAGAWEDIHNVNATHTNETLPSIAADGRGDFAVVAAPDDGVSQPVVVSAYDIGPPTVSAIALAGTLIAGDPVGLTVTATDEWSAVGTPTWTFGDGTTGTGLSVSHAYANPGVFMVHVSVSDGSGNTSGSDLAVTVGAAQATLTSAKFSAKWKTSRVSGTLTVIGTAPRAGSYSIDATKGKSKLHASFDLPVGAFTKAIKLTPKLPPGSYTVTLTTTVPNVKSASQEARLAAPKEGVVDKAWASSTRGGPPALTLVRARNLWATFHFAALPQGKVKVSWFKLGKKRKSFGFALKARAPKIAGSIGSTAAFSGRYLAVLSYKGVVVAQVSVRVTGS